MSGRIRPSARKKTLHNVMHSNLSVTDKGCIDEVFAKFEQQKAEIETLVAKLNAAIAGQETLQKALAEKNAEIEKLTTAQKTMENIIKNTFLENAGCDIDPLAEIKAEAIKEFAERSKALLPYEGMGSDGGFKYGKIKSLDIDNLVKEMVGDAE